MNNITFKEYSPEDRSGCIELLKSTFPDSNDSTFKWRFESEKRRKSLIVCAKQGEKVISFNSWIPWEFRYNENIYLGYQSGESATDINYRGKRLFGKLLNFGEEIASKMGIDFLFGFPSKLSFNPFYRSGYYPISVNHYYLRVLNPFHKSEKRKTEIPPIFNFDQMLFQNNKITPSIDYNYYKWRYLENIKDYEVIEYSENNCVVIFVLRLKKHKGMNEVLLLDFYSNTYNDVVFEHAIKYLDKVYSRKAIYVRTFFNENSDRGQLLKNYFTVRVKSKFSILVIKATSKRISTNILLNSRYWDLMPHCVDEL
jgi:hypothetical protein